MKMIMTPSDLRKRSHQPKPKADRNNQVSVNPFDSIHEYTMPVIHIDFRGRILYANKASFPLLRDWNCLANDYLPQELITQHPELLNPHANFDLRIETKISQFHLDIIGFKESGYIGMYGFRTIYKNETPAPGRSSVASG